MSNKFPPEEGIGFYVAKLAKHLDRRGHSVTIITRGTIHHREYYHDTIKVIEVPYVPLYPFHMKIHGFFVNRVVSSLNDEVDVIHCHIPLTPDIRTDIPIISTLHGSIVGNAKNLELMDITSLGIRIVTKLVSYPLVKKCIDISKTVTCVSRSVAEEISAYYHCDTCTVIGNGVETATFLPSTKRSNDQYILYVGRLAYGKGLFDLYECAKIITKSYETRFMVVGQGALFDTLQHMIEKDNLNDKIILRGQLETPDLIKVYQNAQIFLFPSYYEGLPTVVLEAMSCGLPVITTAVCGCRDIIDHGRNGLLVPPKSPRQLADAVRYLMENENERVKLGQNARKTIEESYDWERIVDAYEHQYRSAVRVP